LQREGLSGVASLISAEMRKRKASLVIFDGLFVAQDAAVSGQSFREFVHELQGLASVFGATLLLLTNQRRDPSSPEYTMVDGWIEMCDEGHGLRSMRSLEVHKQRGGSFMRGRHFFRITDHGIEVFPRVEVALNAEPVTEHITGRMTSGVAGLDAMLLGGYPCASATLLYGPTGSGKTTLGLSFVGGATKEAPALLYSFYETPARLLAKAKALGIDAERLVAEGALKILWRSPAELLVDEVVHEVVREVRKAGIKRVFIDGLHALKAWLVYQDRLPFIVNALNNCLQTLGVTSLYALENRELYLPADLGSDELSAIVNNVMLLHYAMRDGALRRNVTILKLRDSGFDPRSQEFHITDRGVIFGRDTEAQEQPDGAQPRLATNANSTGGQPGRSGQKDG